MCALPRRRASASRRRDQPASGPLNGWDVELEHHLKKNYGFANLCRGAGLCKPRGRARGRARPHPDISFGWGNVEITIWTHKIDGLTESDFILAAKIDEL